jgi:hypothetical protein
MKRWGRERGQPYHLNKFLKLYLREIVATLHLYEKSSNPANSFVFLITPGLAIFAERRSRRVDNVRFIGGGAKGPDESMATIKYGVGDQKRKKRGKMNYCRPKGNGDRK